MSVLKGYYTNIYLPFRQVLGTTKWAVDGHIVQWTRLDGTCCEYYPRPEGRFQ